MLTTKLKNLPSGGSIQGPKVPQLYFRFSHSFWIIAIFVSVAFKLLFYFTKIIVFSLVNYTNHNHTVKFTWIFRMLTVWWFVNIFKILIIHSSVPPPAPKFISLSCTCVSTSVEAVIKQHWYNKKTTCIKFKHLYINSSKNTKFLT